MRLDRYLNDRTGKGREAVKSSVRRGLVTVNGAVIKDPGYRLSENDQVTLEGKVLSSDNFEYYILHKPAGFVTARTDDRSPVVMDLVPSSRKDLSPVGRLDKDTEGLLLITNDGDLNHRLLSPRSHVDKTYYLECDSPFPDDAEKRLSEPIEFSDFTSMPAVFERITDTSGYLTIREGKFHQVKRMLHHIGCEVTYLKRISFGDLKLGDLEKGACRPLTAEEIIEIRNRKYE